MANISMSHGANKAPKIQEEGKIRCLQERARVWMHLNSVAEACIRSKYRGGDQHAVQSSSHQVQSVGLPRTEKSRKRARSSEDSRRSLKIFKGRDSLRSVLRHLSRFISSSRHGTTLQTKLDAFPQRAEASHLWIVAHLHTLSRTLSPGTIPFTWPATAHSPDQNINISYSRKPLLIEPSESGRSVTIISILRFSVLENVCLFS